MTQRRTRFRNPYIAGRALADGRGFFGREEIFQAIEQELASPDRGAIVLFGQRRIGKTSILLRLVQNLDPERFLPIYLDLMDRANRPLGEVLHALAAVAALALGREIPKADEFDDGGEHFQHKVLPRLYELAGNRKPCFVLDEFDVLDRIEEERLSDRAATRTFFPYLRRLMEQESRLGFVFVIGRKAEDLSIDLKALFKATRSKRVSALSHENADKLIRTAEREGSLVFEDAGVERIIELTSGHPYLTQLYCQLIWDRARPAEESDPSLPTIGVEAVNGSLPQVLEAGENIFEWIWDGLPAAERVILSVLAPAAGLEGALALDDLTEVLQQNGVRILIRELEIAPKTLAEWDLLQERGGKFRFLVELLRLWVISRKPIERVREELDRIDPLADSLYQSARGYRNQGDSERCLDLLRQTLLANPNHLKGRLMIAEVQVELGNVAEALDVLEEARRIDQVAVRYPMIRALLQLADSFERTSNLNEALLAYDRILEISPRENTARRRRAEIWIERGRNFLAEVPAEIVRDESELDRVLGLLDRAKSAFSMAGELAKVREIEAIERSQQEGLGDRLVGFVGEVLAGVSNSLIPSDTFLSNMADSANSLYMRAGVKEKIVRVGALKREVKLFSLKAIIAQLEAAEDWTRVESGCREIEEEFGEIAEIRERHLRARKKLELRSLYGKSVARLERGDQIEAIRGLADVINIEPTYQDAALLLASAVNSLRSASSVPPQVATTGHVVNALERPVLVQKGENKIFSSEEVRSTRLPEAVGRAGAGGWAGYSSAMRVLVKFFVRSLVILLITIATVFVILVLVGLFQ